MAELPTATSTEAPSTADASAGEAVPAKPHWNPKGGRLVHMRERTKEEQSAAKVRHVRKHSSPQFQLKKATFMLGRELNVLRKKQVSGGLDARERAQLFKMGETLAYLAKLEQQLEKAKVKELATMSTEEVIEKLRVMKYQRAPESRELVKEMEPDGIDEADDDDGTEDS